MGGNKIFRRANMMRKIAVLIAMVCVSILAKAKDTSEAPIQGAARRMYGFIENRGQIKDQFGNGNERVKYLLPLNDFNVLLTQNGFSYEVYQEVEGRLGSWRLDVEFAGVNPNVRIKADQPAGDHVVYTTGEMAMAVSHFRRIVYEGIYPGVDVEFVLTESKSKPFEYNFIIAPGVSIDVIKMRYTSGSTISVVDGGIVAKLGEATLKESIPASFGASSNRPFQVDYKVDGNVKDGLVIGFLSTDVRDSSEFRVIDPAPVVIWSSYYGGEITEEFFDTELDAEGNIYACGATSSFTMIATAGAHQTSLGGTWGSRDFVVVKFNAAGVRQWATYYGGAGDEYSYAIKLDQSGNIYVAGVANSHNAISTPGAYQTEKLSNINGALVKFNSQGVRIWGTYFGGNGDVFASDIGVDASGYVYVTGTAVQGVIATNGSFQPTSAGGKDAFLMKFSPEGNRVWGTYCGGAGDDEGKALVMGSGNNIYLVGTTQGGIGLSSPLVPEATVPSDVFIAKFSSSGAFNWNVYYGGTGEDVVTDVGVDGNGHLVITGTTRSTSGISSFSGNSLQGGTDMFVAKLTTLSGSLVWGSYFGGTGDDFGQALDIDSRGDIYLTGYTYSNEPDAFATPEAYRESPIGAGDVFLMRVGYDGSRHWSTFFGGIDVDRANDISIFNDGEYMVVAGVTTSTEIGTAGSHQPVYQYGNGDAFITKFRANCDDLYVDPAFVPSRNPVLKDKPFSITATRHRAGREYLFSFYYGSAVMDQLTTTGPSVSYTFRDLSGGVSSLGSHTIAIKTSYAGRCSKTINLVVDVKDIIPLCETTIPLTASDVRLDKASGAFVLQVSQDCPVYVDMGCIQGQLSSPKIANVVAASAVTFSDEWDYGFLGLVAKDNPYLDGRRGKWRPQSTYTYSTPIAYQAKQKNFEAGKFSLSHFNWQNPNVNTKSGWVRSSTVTKYTPNGDAVEELNALNLPSTAKFGYGGAVPFLVAQNAGYDAVMFESFERSQTLATETKLEDGVVLGDGNALNKTSAHSGRQSLVLNTTFSSRPIQSLGKTLQLRFWMNGSLSNIQLNVSSGTALSLKLLATVGSWSLFESTISPGTGPLTVSLNKTGSGTVLIDDVRIQPIDAEMTCYVYDARSLRLLATLDDQHFGMYYQYNDQGQLVRKQVETERGVKTIQETQYNMPAKKRTP